MAELVLIVDDDARNAKLARDVLESAGLRTMTATTAADAIVLACAHRPDLVLMDLRLPDLDGFEAARRLAADERTAGVKVVALSAQPASEASGWAAEAGFAAYIEKPIDVALFPDQVRRHCSPGRTEGSPLS
ncbi:MAG TPA: response regulator [Gaiellaceae bacterium]|jgi:two-component system cell cycle response regulator DivK|nr:response regulator [Gaiellaceae bacterium]